MLIRRDTQKPDSIIKAPVLIWKLDLEKSSKQAYKWMIKRGEDYPVYLNPLLVSHIENDEQITLRNLSEEYFIDSVIDTQEVAEICNKILHQLRADEEYPMPTITDCPGSDTIKNLEINKPVIRWSGVFGIYKSPKQSIIKDVNHLLQNQNKFRFGSLPDGVENDELLNINQRIETDFYNNIGLKKHHAETDKFSSVPTDPSQQAIVSNLGQYSAQIIQGPPGTGKSQSLTALLTNALSNNAKCLVVCEKRTALEVLQNNFNELGLGELCIIIEDIAKDRAKVVNSVRDRLQRQPNMGIKTQKSVYDNLLQQAGTLRSSLNAKHEFLHQKRLGDDNWTDIVAQYLECRQEADNQLIPEIDDLLLSADFEFSYEEFRPMLLAVQQGQPRFAQIGVTDHPLEAAHNRFFESEKVGEIRLIFRQLLDAQLNETKHLQQRFMRIREEYANALQQHYQQYYDTANTKLTQLIGQLETNLQGYGKAFDAAAGLRHGWVKTLSFVSQKHQQILEKQVNAIDVYKALVLHQDAHGYFEYERALPETKGFTYGFLLENCRQMQQRLVRWWSENAQTQLQHDLAIWQPDNTHFALLNFEKKVQTAFEQGKMHLQNLNQSQLLASNAPLNFTTFDGLVAGFQMLAGRLETVAVGYGDFLAFYDWKHFYLQCTALQQKVLDALMRKNPPDWGLAFRLWYFNFLLARNENTNTPTNEREINELNALTAELRRKQSDRILDNWHEAQAKAVRKFNAKGENHNVRRLYNKRGSKGQRRNSLRKILQADLELFTNFFPILMVNPVVCSSILPLRENLFELVVFDEASQLRIEDTFCALLRGKSKIVSGDIHQMPPTNYFALQSEPLLLDDASETSEEMGEETIFADDTDLAIKESLLEYADDMGYQRSYLDFHYRSRHPHLIAFSNAAFYGSRLVPMPPQHNYKAMRFYAVDGLYENRTNEAEAERVIDVLLNEIHPFSHYPDEEITEREDELSIPELPGVGIATFNLNQRNLILEKMQQRKLDDPIAAQKLAALEAKGLFVKNLENIQGDERDIIILSTTFGKRPDGRFLQLFGHINQAKGYKLLNVIITRAKYRVYVCTSVPEEFYMRYALELNEKGNTGRACFYAYMAYARAIENNDESMRNAILEQLANNCEDASDGEFVKQWGRSSRFVDWLAIELKKELPDTEVLPYSNIGGFKTDLLLRFPEGSGLSPTVIECDGAKAHDSPQAWLHDIYRQKRFHALGYGFVRTWSANWWLDTVAERKRLLGLLEVRN